MAVQSIFPEMVAINKNNNMSECSVFLQLIKEIFIQASRVKSWVALRSSNPTYTILISSFVTFETKDKRARAKKLRKDILKLSK